MRRRLRHDVVLQLKRLDPYVVKCSDVQNSGRTLGGVLYLTSALLMLPVVAVLVRDYFHAPNVVVRGLAWASALAVV
jgi:hypothetical protein